MPLWPQTREDELRRRGQHRTVLRANGCILATTMLLGALVMAVLTVDEVVRLNSIEPLMHWQFFALLALVVGGLAAGIFMYRSGGRVDVHTPNPGLPTETDLAPRDPRRRLSSRTRRAINFGFLLVQIATFIGFMWVGMATHFPSDAEWARTLFSFGGACASAVGLRVLQNRITGQ